MHRVTNISKYIYTIYYSLTRNTCFKFFSFFFLLAYTNRSIPVESNKRIESLQLQVHADRGRSPGEDPGRKDVRRVVHRDGQREGDQGGERRVGGHSPEGEPRGDRGDPGVPLDGARAWHQGGEGLAGGRRPRGRPTGGDRRQPGTGVEAAPLLQRQDIVVRRVRGPAGPVLRLGQGGGQVQGVGRASGHRREQIPSERGDRAARLLPAQQNSEQGCRQRWRHLREPE